MSVGPDEIAFARDLFSGLGPLTTRKMMGGLCLYSGGRIFAILDSEGSLYLKATGPLAEALAAEGSSQFGEQFDARFETSRRPGRRMGYWTLPAATLDDPDLACDWARRALARA